MKINIAQALKEKKRLAGEITCLWQLFQSENFCGNTHRRKIDVAQTLQTIDHYTAKLVELKTKLCIANQGDHFRKLQLLAEKRAQLERLSSTSGSEDQEWDRNGNPLERTAVFNEEALVVMRKKCLREIDALQDQIDVHNIRTQIDFETPLK